MDYTNLIESLLRWLHVVSGIVWIGHLYFFNWVNLTFVPTMDAETRKKVVPELMPRALYFFRWGAAYTWVTGVLLLYMVFYGLDFSGQTLFSGPEVTWGAAAVIMILVVFLGVLVYDFLLARALKNPTVLAIVAFVLASVVVFLMASPADFSFRGYSIHLGALFGTIMAYNVWFRIWPAQQKIITAVKSGVAPDATLVALAGTRSRHNVYMSVPLVFTMVNMHGTWVASSLFSLPILIIVGWLAVWLLYGKSRQVKGF